MDVTSRARSRTPAALTGDLERTTAPQQRGQPGSSVYSRPGKKGRGRLISGLFPQPSSENDVGMDVDINGSGTCRDTRRPPDLREQRKNGRRSSPGGSCAECKLDGTCGGRALAARGVALRAVDRKPHTAAPSLRERECHPRFRRHGRPRSAAARRRLAHDGRDGVGAGQRCPARGMILGCPG